MNMFCITLILILVLGIFFTTNAARQRSETEEFMRADLSSAMGKYSRNQWKGKGIPEDLEPFENTHDGPRSFFPRLFIHADSSLDIIKTTERDIQLGEANAATLLAYVSPTGESGSGEIPSQVVASLLTDADYAYTLKYIYEQAVTGDYYIIFTDTSFENDSIHKMLLSCIKIFVVAFVLFLVLSYFLASWAVAPTRKAWQQQSRFVADASHELKTPITVILANLDILGAHADDTIKNQSKWIDNTKQEARRMKDLVEDLLFLARSDADAVPLTMSEVDLSDCLIDRMLGFESLAFERHITMEDDIEMGLKILGNEPRIKQLLTILLDNACKYAGEHGHVWISAKKSEGSIFIRIKNTGDTISPDDIEHIFERFYRADKSRSRSDGGYGLGLAIAQNIVLSHHGKISCESGEDGTTFVVELEH